VVVGGKSGETGGERHIKTHIRTHTHTRASRDELLPGYLRERERKREREREREGERERENEREREREREMKPVDKLVCTSVFSVRRKTHSYTISRTTVPVNTEV
jgi:hypothetical protein